MAKKNTNKKKKVQKRAQRTGRDLIVTAAGDMIGRALTHVATEGVHRINASDRGNGQSNGGLLKARDAAAETLRALHEHGAMTVQELFEHTKVSLTGMLRALRDAREFGLVEFDSDSTRVELTDAGGELAPRLEKPSLRDRAKQLLPNQ